MAQGRWHAKTICAQIGHIPHNDDNDNDTWHVTKIDDDDDDKRAVAVKHMKDNDVDETEKEEEIKNSV